MKRIPALLAALLAASCSNPSSSPTAASPSRPQQSSTAMMANGLGLGAAPEAAPVRTQAAGDVQNGPLEIVRVRVRQGSAGFYAQPGGAYNVAVGDPIELWVEWNPTSPVSTVPRLIVDWSSTLRDNIHCGPCLLNNTYRQAGSYSVTVTLDDRVGGTTKRTFTFNAGTTPTGPEIVTVSQTVVGTTWTGTYRVSHTAGVTVNVRSIRWLLAATGIQVGTQADLPGWVSFSANQLPGTFSISGALNCSVTEGLNAQFRWIWELVGADGLVTSVEHTTSAFPCSGKPTS